jgi:hypothetical protein
VSPGQVWEVDVKALQKHTMHLLHPYAWELYPLRMALDILHFVPGAHKAGPFQGGSMATSTEHGGVLARYALDNDSHPLLERLQGCQAHAVAAPVRSMRVAMCRLNMAMSWRGSILQGSFGWGCPGE